MLHELIRPTKELLKNFETEVSQLLSLSQNTTTCTPDITIVLQTSSKALVHTCSMSTVLEKQLNKLRNKSIETGSG